MPGPAGSARLFVATGDEPPVAVRPGHDVLSLPDLAHVEHGLRGGEVGAVDELLDPLAADAEQAADLSRADELLHSGKHRHHATSHLTIGQRGYTTSHLTRA